MKKKPTDESITSIRSRLNTSLIPRRKDRSFTNKITAKTNVNPYKPAFIGSIKYFFKPIKNGDLCSTMSSSFVLGIDFINSLIY